MSQTLFHLSIHGGDQTADKYYESLTALQMDKGPVLGIKDAKLAGHDWSTRLIGIDGTGKIQYTIDKGELLRARDIRKSRRSMKESLQPSEANRVG